MPQAKLPSKSSETPKVTKGADAMTELKALRAKVAAMEKQQNVRALPCFIESFIVKDDGSYTMTGSFAGTEVIGDVFTKGNGQFLCDPDQRSNKKNNSQWVQSNGFGFLIRPGLLDSK